MALRGFTNSYDIADGEVSIWDDNSKIVFLTSAETMDIVSTSALDTSAGTGARTLILNGLDASFEPILEVITMNGTTPVVSVNSYLRITNCVVLSCGSLQENQGEIVLLATTTGSTQGFMNINESVIALSYTTIPAGFRGYLTKIQAQCEGSTGGGPLTVWRLLIHLNQLVGSPIITGFKFIIDSSIENTCIIETDIGGPIEPTSDVSLVAFTDTNNTLATSAVFIYFKAI